MIDLDRMPPEIQQRFDAVDRSARRCSPLGELTARALPELDAGYVEAVEDGWTANVLQR